jgi:hypothetical protein
MLCKARRVCGAWSSVDIALGLHRSLEFGLTGDGLEETKFPPQSLCCDLEKASVSSYQK